VNGNEYLRHLSTLRHVDPSQDDQEHDTKEFANFGGHVLHVHLAHGFAALSEKLAVVHTGEWAAWVGLAEELAERLVALLDVELEQTVFGYEAADLLVLALIPLLAGLGEGTEASVFARHVGHALEVSWERREEAESAGQLDLPTLLWGEAELDKGPDGCLDRFVPGVNVVTDAEDDFGIWVGSDEFRAERGTWVICDGLWREMLVFI